MPVLIGAIGRSEGQPKEIEHARLRSDGFAHFVESAKPITVMASEAIQDCLAQAQIEPSAIDGAIISTESLWDTTGPADPSDQAEEHIRLRDHLLTALLDKGLHHALPFGNWLSGCANSFMSIRLAECLVSSGQHRCVLVVVTDRVRPGSSRLVRNEAGVYSDVAVACLVTDLPQPFIGFRVDHLVLHSYLPLLIDGEDPYGRAKEIVAALRTFEKKIKAHSGKTLRDYESIISNNLSREYYEFICHCLSIDIRRLSFPSRASTAHAFSVDWLLSLRQQRAETPQDGGPVAVLNLGPCVFGFAELSR